MWMFGGRASPEGGAVPSHGSRQDHACPGNMAKLVWCERSQIIQDSALPCHGVSGGVRPEECWGLTYFKRTISTAVLRIHCMADSAEAGDHQEAIVMI